MTRLRRSASILGVLLVALLGLAAPAVRAQEDAAPVLRIEQVDSTDPASTELIVTWTGAAAELSSADLVVNGEPVSADATEPVAPADSGVVLVIDNSEVMDGGGALVRIREELVALVEARPEGQAIAVVAVGGGNARTVRSWSTDTAAIVESISGLAPNGSSALWDGVIGASRLVASRPNQVSSVVMVAGGADAAGAGFVARARGALSSTGAPALPVVIDGRGLDTDAVRSLVGAAGGTYRSTANPLAVGDLLDEVAAEIGSTYRVTFASPVSSGPVDLTLTAGDVSTSISYVAGARVGGAAALAPVTPNTPGGVGFLRNSGFIIGVILAVAAVGLGVYAIGSLFVRDDSLTAVLRPYAEGGDLGDDDGPSSMASTAIIQRAVSLTEGMARRQGLLPKIEGLLERANLPLRAAEALFFYMAGVVLLVVLVGSLTRNVMATVVVAGLIALIFPAILSYLARRRQKRFMALLPDTLQLLAGTLKAGYSLMQGVEAVSRETAEPMGQELRRIVTEARLGRPLEESMEASAMRMDSADFQWAVMAIRIQREVGGNLAELLLTVADTMVQRERLRRDVSALTAEGRVSAVVLGMLPIGLGLAMWVINPDYIRVLFDETIGNFLLAGSIVLALIGFVWMRKVIQIDV